MKRALIISGIVLVVILVLFIGVWVFVSSKSSSQTAPPASTTTFPIASTTNSGGGVTSGSGTMSLAAQTGGTVVTKDFVHNGVTAEDTENPGNYYLAGSLGYCTSDGNCPSGASTTDYHIVYFSQDESFIISLINEPIGQSRLEAEQFMMQTLGITQTQMCNLKYQVLTTDSVNSDYAGQNLGFSFCPGSVKLP